LFLEARKMGLFSFLRRSKKESREPEAYEEITDDYFLVKHRRGNRTYAISKSHEQRFFTSGIAEFFVCHRVRRSGVDIRVPFYFEKADLEHYEALAYPGVPQLF
jgi:hypothetical protein